MVMMTEAPAATLTYEAYMAEPETEGRYDIINGVRVLQPELSWNRQRIIVNLAARISVYGRRNGGHTVISPFDVLIQRNPLQIRQPDLLLISHDRLMQGGGPPKIGPLEIGPELVVEIVMDDEAEHVLRDKIVDYLRIKVNECWVVRPTSGTVEVLLLTPSRARSFAIYGNREIFSSPIFPGLGVPVAEVFAP